TAVDHNRTLVSSQIQEKSGVREKVRPGLRAVPTAVDHDRTLVSSQIQEKSGVREKARPGLRAVPTAVDHVRALASCLFEKSRAKEKCGWASVRCPLPLTTTALFFPWVPL